MELYGNCIVTMGFVPEIKYFVSYILYHVSCILYAYIECINFCDVTIVMGVCFKSVG